MKETYVLGAAMNRFGKYQDQSLKDLCYDPIWQAIRESQVDPHDIDIAFVGNAYGGVLQGQESIRGQGILREAGITGIPIINVENACASGSTAFHLAHRAVASGQAKLALAVGAEKLFCGDTPTSLKALATSTDVGVEGQMGMVFSGIYAMRFRQHMEKYGITHEQLAQVAAKNHFHGSLNPHSQYQKARSVEEVLASRMIADPITLLMVCPLGDGAAACLIGDKEMARAMGKRPVRVGSSMLGSFDISGRQTLSIANRTAQKAYAEAGVTAKDIQLAEVHDAVAPIELYLYEELGFCGPGESGRMMDERATWLDGRLPVNTSGGLTAKGHPAGATGIAQVAEICWQLRGEAGKRQMPKLPDVGMTENGGGNMAGETAVVAVNILQGE